MKEDDRIMQGMITGDLIAKESSFDSESIQSTEDDIFNPDKYEGGVRIRTLREILSR